MTSKLCTHHISFNSKMESPTFLSTLEKILDHFDTKYATINSLPEIVSELESLPVEEKAKHGLFIYELRITINGFGKTNRRISDAEADRLYRQIESYFHLITLKALTFTDVLDDILARFEVRYATVNSLQGIIQDLDNLSKDQRDTHNWKIELLKGTIKSFGVINKRLTDEQVNKLYKQISNDRESLRTTPYTLANYNPNWLDNRKCKSDVPLTNIPRKTIGHDELYNSNFANVEKLDLDDAIAGPVFNLLTNLSRDTLGSNLNLFVEEYFKFKSDLKKYEPISYEIRICLIKHSWKCKVDASAGGFQTQPNRIKLLDELTAIVNKYF